MVPLSVHWRRTPLTLLSVNAPAEAEGTLLRDNPGYQAQDATHFAYTALGTCVLQDI